MQGYIVTSLQIPDRYTLEKAGDVGNHTPLTSLSIQQISPGITFKECSSYNQSQSESFHACILNTSSQTGHITWVDCRNFRNWDHVMEVDRGGQVFESPWSKHTLFHGSPWHGQLLLRACTLRWTANLICLLSSCLFTATLWLRTSYENLIKLKRYIKTEV